MVSLRLAGSALKEIDNIASELHMTRAAVATLLVLNALNREQEVFRLFRESLARKEGGPSS